MMFENIDSPSHIFSNINFTQSLMQQNSISKRKISKTPFKILDAPALQDDFYLNLLDWSC